MPQRAQAKRPNPFEPARLAEETPARLIVFPETALPNFFDRIDPAYIARL